MIVAAVTGCALNPPPTSGELQRQAMPHTSVPAAWKAAAAADAAVADRWLASFEDPALSTLVDEAQLHNADLQVAAAHQLNLNPVLLAATNSSGGVAGKMISPQHIAVGVTTVGLAGAEGQVLRSTFWHSVLFAALVGALAWVQAYLATWMIP